MNKLIFDPLEEYRDKFKPLHNENVTLFVQDLIEKSGIDKGANAITVKEVKTLEHHVSIEEKALSKARGQRVFLIIMTVIFFVALFYFIIDLSGAMDLPAFPLGSTASLIFAIIAALLIVLFIFLIVKKVNPKIKDANTRLNELNSKLKAKRNEAWNQMAPLNRLFDETMAAKLVEKTIPLLSMDPVFDSRRFDYLNRKYGLSKFSDVNESAVFVQSGEIQGNPFLLSRSLYMNMGTKTYTGSITVSYTVTVYVNNKAQRQTRTETLTATVTKPCPYYNNDTILIYGNEAAPNLSFNRTPQLPLDWTNKSLESLVKREEKEMRKRADQALKKGKTFTPLGNSEFEALFNAYNRDHELEYRLLFTALGQSEISDLIKDKTVGFGDNFEFHKVKNINIIRSRHSQSFDYRATPDFYIHYDHTQIKKRFVEYNNAFLRHFYFNIAPILAVPLYQQHKPHEFIYGEDYESHLSFYEHEVAANGFDSQSVAHPDSRTSNILKTRVIAKGVNFDAIEITSHGFTTIARTDYVTRVAGNGSVHSVPVHWLEYIPVSRSTQANVRVLNDDEKEKVTHGGLFSKITEHLEKHNKTSNPITSRHVMAFLVAKKFSDQDQNAFDDLFKDANE